MNDQIYSTLSYPIVYSVSQLTGAILGLACLSILKKLKFDEKQSLGLGFLLALVGTLTLYISYTSFVQKNPLPVELAFLTIFFGLNIPVLLSSFFLPFILPFIWEFLREKIE